MSNKCFITKYQSSVDNDTLPYYGTLVFHFEKSLESVSMANRVLSIVCGEVNEDLKVKIVKGGHFTDYAGTEDKGKTGSLKNGNNIFYVSNEDTDIVVFNSKYSGAILRIDANDYQNAPYNAKLYYDISQLKYLDNLTSISTRYYNTDKVKHPMSGDISALSNLTSLTQLSLSNSNVSGDISALSNLTSLTQLSLSNSNVSGDISALSNLTSLTVLTLSNSNVSGDISALSNLTSLTVLGLSKSNVSGDLTNIANKLTNLKNLYISKGQFTNEDAAIKTLTDNGCTVTAQ